MLNSVSIPKLFFPALVTILAAAPLFAAKAVLNEIDATTRSTQIKDLSYQVNLDLTRAQKEIKFTGNVEIDFEALQEKPNSTLFLDFASENASEIVSLTVNQKKSAFVLAADKTQIHIPSNEILWGEKNSIYIEFSAHFTQKGKGFHREVDPEDGEVYVYTNLEPFFANEVFPLFDQPDLKGIFTYTISAPQNWIVVTNSLVLNTTEAESSKIWKFNPTPKMSSYLIGISAGPWVEFKPHEQHSRIPLNLYSRKSLAKFVEAEIWFALTKDSLAKYEEIFGQYPYEKYDQLIVPGNASGAMESLAAITFNEAYVARGPMSTAQKTALARTLVHEMAHQWFGNLVTMKWWDDLWLNESFATFMSTWILSQIGPNHGLFDSWGQFFGDEKTTAYHADSYDTTHPIVTQAVDTKTGFANFDSITYDKGASVLKQLFFKVGPEDFFAAIRSYFAKYSEKNATCSQFIAELSAAANIDLTSWSKAWLQTSGTNSLHAQVHEDKERILHLKQFPDPKSHILRPHRTTIGLYNLNQEGKLVLQQSLEVDYAEAETSIILDKSQPKPEFVFANLNDQDLAHVILDSEALVFLEKNLAAIQDSLLKQQIYHSLWQMVTHRQWDAKRFVALVCKNASTENDAALLESLYLQLRAALGYVAKEQRATLNEKITEFFFTELRSVNPGSDKQEMLFYALTRLVLNPQQQQLLAAWISDDDAALSAYLTSFELHQDRRWKIVLALARSGFQDWEEILQKEENQDKSERGIIAAKTVRAAVPNKESKKLWFEELAVPNDYNLGTVRSIGGYIHDVMRPELTDFVAENFLDAVLTLSKKELDRKTGIFIRLLYPRGYSIEFDINVRKFVEERKDELSPLVIRALLESAEDSACLFTATQ